MIRFEITENLPVDQFIGVLKRSGLDERRPVEDFQCIHAMLSNSNLIATAWRDDLLVGVARSVTDFVYCCYLSDLAVDRAFQLQGVGRGLISTTQSVLGQKCKIVLLSAPAAKDYYPKVGFHLHPSAWVLPNQLAKDANTEQVAAGNGR
jgi:GNAT superfamily N-acetyltransferase